MFQRGQKIVVLESSASKRAHPAVGDIGYVNNMYLFFKARFILLDAFFLSYPTDIKNNIDRCERKRFLVDLGMTKNLKYKLRAKGLPRKFFIENNYVANLTPYGYTFEPMSYIESPNITSMWLRIYNQKGNHMGESNTKIPYGQIAIVPNRKESITEKGKNSLGCWIQCLLPILSSETDAFPSNYLDVVTISSIVSNNHYRKLVPKHRRGKALTSGNVNNVIKDMRLIQVMSKFFLDGCDSNFFVHPFLLDNRSSIRALWASAGSISGTMEKAPEPVNYALVGIFFRSIIMSKDIKNDLYKLKINNILPWSNDKINTVAKKLSTIVQEADSNSAALARIFEEDHVV